MDIQHCHGGVADVRIPFPCFLAVGFSRVIRVWWGAWTTSPDINDLSDFLNFLLVGVCWGMFVIRIDINDMSYRCCIRALKGVISTLLNSIRKQLQETQSFLRFDFQFGPRWILFSNIWISEYGFFNMIFSKIYIAANLQGKPGKTFTFRRNNGTTRTSNQCWRSSFI